MKIVDADCSFVDDGFRGAVETNKSDIESLKSVQAIIDLARNEGKRKPIINQGAGEMILIQLGKAGDQYACPMMTVLELKDSLEDLFGVN